jgi:hypothetical protein
MQLSIDSAMPSFVAQAPEQDGRMMPVAADHPAELRLRRGLPAAGADALPRTEFRQHQEAQAVARVQKGGRLRIMRQANEIQAELLDAPGIGFLQGLGHGKPETGQVFMAVDTAQDHRRAVDQEPLAGIEVHRAQTEGPVQPIHRAPVAAKGGLDRIERGRIRTPPARGRNHAAEDLAGGSPGGQHVFAPLAFRNGNAGGIAENNLTRNRRGGLAAVLHGQLNGEVAGSGFLLQHPAAGAHQPHGRQARQMHAAAQSAVQMKIRIPQPGQHMGGIGVADVNDQTIASRPKDGRGIQIQTEIVAIETPDGLPVEPGFAHPVKSAAAQPPFAGGARFRQIEIQLIGGPAATNVHPGAVFVGRVPAVRKDHGFAAVRAGSARRKMPAGLVESQADSLAFARRVRRHEVASGASASRDSCRDRVRAMVSRM